MPLHARTIAALAGVAALFGCWPAAVPLAQQATTPASPAAPAGRGYARPQTVDFHEHDGWRSLFDGQTLDGWEGNRDVWKVEDGAIVAETTPEHRIGTTFIMWKEALADFELKLEVKLTGTVNSGIAYRGWTDPGRGARLGPIGASAPAPQPPGGTPAGARGGRGPQGPIHVPSDPRWMLFGAGMDNDADRRTTGNIEDRGTARRLIGWRGSVVRTATGRAPSLVASLGDPDVLRDVVRPDDWNEVHIIARGAQLTHIINGRPMAITFDDDQAFFTPSGLIGWSIETGGFGKVMVRSVWVRSVR